MKVAYITMTFPAPTETFACSDIRALRRAGADVTVHTIRGRRADFKKLLIERTLQGLTVRHGTIRAHVEGICESLKRPSITVSLIRWLFGLTWSRPDQLLRGLIVVPRAMGILSSLEKEPPDVVHLFWGHYPCIVGFLVLTQLPEAILSVFLGAYDLAKPFKGSAWVVQRADVVFTHSRWNVPPIECLGVAPARIHLAYRGIDPTIFYPRKADKTPRRIVAVGRLDDEKRMADVLMVFRRVHSRWPDATLNIVGDGPERGKLERLSENLVMNNSVRFRGHVTQREVADELAAAEVLLLMSSRERLPNVVKEAMASKCVCIVAHTDGIEELIEDGVNGFVVPPKDIEMAAHRVDAILAGEIDKAPVTAAALSHINEFFTASRSMKSYLERWQQIIINRRTPSQSARQLHV